MRSIIISLITITFASSLYAGNLFSTITGMTMEEIKPDKAYTIDTQGINPRTYQFTTSLPDNTKVTCIVLFPNSDGDSSAVAAMQCIRLNP